MDQQHALQGKKYGIEQALTDEQRKELEELGMIWDHNKQKWEEYYSVAKVYYKEHGNLEVPAKYVTADGIPLGRWLSNQTNSRSMTDEQLKRLKSIGYRSESRTAIQWNRKFELAKHIMRKRQSGHTGIILHRRGEAGTLDIKYQM